jgi:hypothetical protein
MRGYRWIVLSMLIAASGAWAALIPFQISEGTATAVHQDSVTLYEVVARSSPDGSLQWIFRLGGSPTEDLNVWVGVPNGGEVIAEGIPDVKPPSTTMKCLLPGAASTIPMTLYNIKFPGDKITLITLRTSSPSPWKPLEMGGAGDYEIWQATVSMQGVAHWAGLVDRIKVSLDLPPELLPVWETNADKFQYNTVPPYEPAENGGILWEFRSWEPSGDLSAQVSAYRPLLRETELLDPPMITLPDEYLGDKVEYTDSLMSGYMWVPAFNELATPSERGVFARAYLWLRQNEILARHGFVFDGDQALRSYFDKQPWYKPDPDFKTEMLNEIEMRNYWKLINRLSEFRPQYPAARE